MRCRAIDEGRGELGEEDRSVERIIDEDCGGLSRGLRQLGRRAPSHDRERSMPLQQKSSADKK